MAGGPARHPAFNAKAAVLDSRRTLAVCRSLLASASSHHSRQHARGLGGWNSHHCSRFAGHGRFNRSRGFLASRPDRDDRGQPRLSGDCVDVRRVHRSSVDFRDALNPPATRYPPTSLPPLPAPAATPPPSSRAANGSHLLRMHSVDFPPSTRRCRMVRRGRRRGSPTDVRKRRSLLLIACVETTSRPR